VVSDDKLLAAEKSNSAKTKVSSEKSRSRKSLPSWIQPVWDSKIAPSLIEVYGSVVNPFDFTGDQRVVEQIQNVVDNVLPESSYVASATIADKPYQVVRD
jgi:hypothetical protein